MSCVFDIIFKPEKDPRNSKHVAELTLALDWLLYFLYCNRKHKVMPTLKVTCTG